VLLLILLLLPMLLFDPSPFSRLASGFNVTKRVLSVKEVAHVPLTEVLVTQCKCDRDLIEQASMSGRLMG
jgi:hypothetical protein